MFERNKIDNADQGTLSVVLTLADGREINGKLAIPAGRTLLEAVNGPALFLDFEAFNGERSLVAKASLTSVKLIKVPRAPNLLQRLRDLDGFDPHAILGVGLDTGWDDVRRAYHALAKTYHPDRYSTAELPDEVQSYLAAMARRINAAFALLETAHTQKKQRKVHLQEPVYTSPARG